MCVIKASWEVSVGAQWGNRLMAKKQGEVSSRVCTAWSSCASRSCCRSTSEDSQRQESLSQVRLVCGRDRAGFGSGSGGVESLAVPASK